MDCFTVNNELRIHLDGSGRIGDDVETDDDSFHSFDMQLLLRKRFAIGKKTQACRRFGDWFQRVVDRFSGTVLDKKEDVARLADTVRKLLIAEINDLEIRLLRRRGGEFDGMDRVWRFEFRHDTDGELRKFVFPVCTAARHEEIAMGLSVTDEKPFIGFVQTFDFRTDRADDAGLPVAGGGDDDERRLEEIDAEQRGEKRAVRPDGPFRIRVVLECPCCFGGDFRVFGSGDFNGIDVDVRFAVDIKAEADDFRKLVPERMEDDVLPSLTAEESETQGVGFAEAVVGAFRCRREEKLSGG